MTVGVWGQSMKLQRFILCAVSSFFAVTESVLAQSVPFSINNFQNSPAQESITTPDGVTCSQNINSRTSLQAGFYGIDASQSSTNVQNFSTSQTPNFGAFVAIVVPLSSPPSTNCGEFAAIELERARLRLQREKEQFEEEKALRTNLQPQNTQNPFYQDPQNPAPAPTQPPAVMPAPPASPQSQFPRRLTPRSLNTAAVEIPIAPPIPTFIPSSANTAAALREEVIPTAPPIPVGFIPAPSQPNQ